MLTVEDFIRAEAPLVGGGSVILLNTRAEITAEDEAMLQALHSRSARGIRGHLEKLLSGGGSGNFMKNFYVGYGHKSIGDCGSTTVFIEGVSMLAAKAIQDWSLYNGQEASTRYIDFAEQAFMDPIGSEASRMIQEQWRGLYVNGLPFVEEYVTQLHPIQPNENEGVYRKAIKARAFDIMRSVLPAGATTNASWHTELRQASDKLEWLRHHPLPEVQDIAQAIEKVLIEGHPNSFPSKRYDASEAYRATFMKSNYYRRGKDQVVSVEPMIVHDGIDRLLLGERWSEFLTSRPPHTELPKQIGECGSVRFEFKLDYGSFRDLQRHRSVVQGMPLLTTKLGFEPWYLEWMPPAVRIGIEAALSLFKGQVTTWLLNGVPEEIVQYYIPMGYQVPISLTGDLAAMVYVAERRSPSDVHPTLQRKALGMAYQLKRRYEHLGLVLHVNPDDLGRFTLKRGTADITERVE